MIRRSLFVKNKIVLGLTAAAIGLSAAQTQAATFEVGGFDIAFDSTFSYGQSIRVEDRDFNLIGKSNNPSFDWTGYNPAINTIYSSQDVWAQPGSYSNNGDAGDLNFDSGETFSKLLKGTHDLSISKDNYGLFTRFMYFYDFELMDGDRAYVNPTSGQGVDPCDDDDTKEQSCADIRLLDAYVWANFDLNEGKNPLSIRVGQQVVNWGESTLISHGINVNPVDIDRLKAPGAELKEAFIPVGMLWASLGLTENMTLEGFYQYQWHETRLPAAGTYFSTNDFAAENGYQQNVQLGFTSNPDIDLAFLTDNLNNLMATYGQVASSQGIDPSSAAGQQLLANMYLAYPTKVALKGKGYDGKTEPDDGGQYGLRLGMFLPEWNDTEVALYHVNYHSRRPLISGRVSNFTQASLQQDLAMIATTEITSDNVSDLKAFAKATNEYPEDIKLYGLSFNTSLGETAFAGEFTFREDEPLQIDDVELLYAAMPEQLAIAGLRPEFAGISQMSKGDAASVVGPGELAKGYIERNTSQLQFTATHLFGPSLGADSWAVVGEIGGVRINNMPEYDEMRLNVSGTGRSGIMQGPGSSDYSALHMALSNGPEQKSFATASSWGYRLIAKGDYFNIYNGINFSPRFVFSHDVNGNTPDPMFLFIEDRKSLGATMSFNYQNAWSLDVSYNSFWGGGDTNTFSDRDYVSFNLKYSI
ncbi:MAG: hypothetical protein ACI9H9_000253 [Pseudoalteromonas tetraodonis]|jgi:hypothetical protein|uniref:DUF1302 domain-containing protein n=2 Tax=Pseudoalteromonas TaxID=53246 RepID=A0AA37W1W9_9GAMM|nr:MULTISPECIES: DUF1302 domain-containing protein [Pseudoalteromonas]MAY58186.1 DUF1302 domain-containing protein [Pseudoalteromonas sp.]ATC90711.1 hypothetical protein PISS_a1830 [Pseudoalteromonas issachenkonii]ATD03289.1 hypothetical protein PTET_a1898 [Pseudoalteromonas tetraodonis]MDN3407490.1 DUF1302 domain-containing protein [Pseudoalteromonas sp. APC 3894]MDN3414801.1 DUF1302 domain-containing protein [Pseudoalteromonas sp. APC 3227]|tara:strand:- start:4888 stop:6984 length:2097 start_codon:yes stop_codon:yes gene_type:complete